MATVSLPWWTPIHPLEPRSQIHPPFWKLLWSWFSFLITGTESLPMQCVKAQSLQLTALHEVKAPAVTKPALPLSLEGDRDQVPLRVCKPAPSSVAASSEQTIRLLQLDAADTLAGTPSLPGCIGGYSAPHCLFAQPFRSNLWAHQLSSNKPECAREAKGSAGFRMRQLYPAGASFAS